MKTKSVKTEVSALTITAETDTPDHVDITASSDTASSDKVVLIAMSWKARTKAIKKKR